MNIISFAASQNVSTHPVLAALFLLSFLTGCGGGSSSSSSGSPPIPEPEPEARLLVSELSFASSRIQGCVETHAINENWLYADEITYIRCSNLSGGETNLEGMEVFANMPQASLIELWLGGSITNLLPIAGLTTLRELHLSRHKLIDLSPLSTLTQLELLRLHTTEGCGPETGCDLRDISPLADLDNLKQLILNDRNSDLLSQVSLLTNLEYLEIDRMEVRTLAWADGLAKLKVLNLTEVANVKHYDIDGLVFLENLRELYLPPGNPKNNSLQPIASLKKLQTLNLCNITLDDLSPLAQLVEMEQLWITQCVSPSTQGSIVDISALSEMVNLRRLAITHQLIEDISPLQNLTKLESLGLTYLLIEDLSPLQNLKKLESLSLSYNRIGDNTEVLAGLSNLKYLYLNNNNIAYLPTLDSLMQLTHITLDHNRIQNLQPLAGLSYLELLSISHNGLQDISPLSNYDYIDTLDLGHNDISDLSPLREIQRLRIVKIKTNSMLCEQINELKSEEKFSIWTDNPRSC